MSVAEPMDLPRPGSSAYLTIGWPSPHTFLSIISSIGGCIDFMELGIPAKRPIYDGPVIRLTHREASGLASGLRGAVTLAREAGIRLGKPVILMSYLSEFGGDVKALVEAAAQAEAISVLSPDLLFEYFDRIGDYIDVIRMYGMKPSFFVSSKFPHKILSKLASTNPLLIYLGLQPATGVNCL